MVAEPAVEVRHGYTLADLHRMARIACGVNRRGDIRTRLDLAFSAIALALCEAETPPSHTALVNAGVWALRRETQEVVQLRGYSREDGEASAPKFVVYWTPREDRRAEDDLIEKLALRQIFNTLTEAQRAAVVALAALGDYRAAAGSLKIRRGTFLMRLMVARRRFRAHWYAPETPPPHPRDIRIGSRTERAHCANGHELSDDNVYRARTRRSRADRKCKTCETERSRLRWAKEKAARKAATT